MQRRVGKKKWGLIFVSVVCIIGIVVYGNLLPEKLFRCSYSTVIYSNNNELLGATVATDGQWRFPEDSVVSDKFIKALISFEDRHFYQHPGINPYSLIRAARQNWKAGKIVSGGSTLSMQLIRISRKGKNRTYVEKAIELILATRLEIRYSKNRILELYAAHAPFGGNIVGLQAASWRYFGRNANNLSWAEAATLAILPNAPALVHPGRNRGLLLIKRNKLLYILFKRGYLNQETLGLSLLEQLPDKPYDLPQLAPHLLQRIAKKFSNGAIKHTTIDVPLQQEATELLERHMSRLRANYIFNAAILVIDIENGNILAYVGNSKPINKEEHGNQVDIIGSARRSTGSVLKPFLYAASLDAGEILPSSLIPDVPVIISGYSPKNFSNNYDGAVHAQQALARSLNIPAVFLLRDYGVQRFYDLLKKSGMTTLNRSSANYGLSLILGGAEGNLEDICSMYTGLARNLRYYSERSDKYSQEDYSMVHYLAGIKVSNPSKNSSSGIIGAGAIWHTFNAMLEVNKPMEENGWENYLSTWKVAWKTGTSFGFRDAWAVGLNSHYVVGVWVGNADGIGRPGLTGVDCAAPIMFEVFRELNKYGWFNIPTDDLQQAAVCHKSGFLAGENCPDVDSLDIPVGGLNSRPCPYHRKINLDESGKFRVNSECESVYRMKQTIWFVLPPMLEVYYKHKDPSYKLLPPFKKSCIPDAVQTMEFIYPNEGATLYLPVNMNQEREKVIFKQANKNPKAHVYWHLDGYFAGETQGNHELALEPLQGNHVLVVIDDDGVRITRHFNVIHK
jgi:penicillin-binding protein 1C